MYYTYILQSKKDNNFYVGYTNDIRRRLSEHNSGKIKATRNRKPFKLILYEAFLHQQDATAREKYFKTGWGRKHLRAMLKNYLGG